MKTLYHIICCAACLLLSVQTAGAKSYTASDTLQSVNREALLITADSAYSQGCYEQAYAAYTLVARDGVHPKLYYNIGNTCFKMKRFPEAILWYERSLRYDPADEDARYNLSVCRSRVHVREGNGQEMFLLSWLRRTLASLSVDGWGFLLLVFLSVSMTLVVCCRRLPRLWMRKTASVLLCPAILACLLCIVAAVTTYHRFRHTTLAVVMKDTPVQSEGSTREMPVLAAGYTLEVLDKSPSGLWLIENTDIPVKGWVNAVDLEEI